MFFVLTDRRKLARRTKKCLDSLEKRNAKGGDHG